MKKNTKIFGLAMTVLLFQAVTGVIPAVMSQTANVAVTHIDVNDAVFGKGVAFDPAKSVVTQNSTVVMKGSNLLCIFEKDALVRFKPEAGTWNFRKGNAIAVTIKNEGLTSVIPKLQVSSRNDRSTDLATIGNPLQPGVATTLIASFIPKRAWEAGEIIETHNGIKPGTGTLFESNHACEIVLFANEGAQLEVLDITLIAPHAALPDWLGKQPPVSQNEVKNWKMTFDENFDKPLDLKVWNIYTDNFWDRRTHFSKDNSIVKDGKLILRYEKKRGFHNDDSNETFGDNGQTDYTCGHADTYGKWTQCYGYFEARLKLPDADGLWPAFWTMPDRGKENGPEQWKRASTQQGGMEFDIMEHLSGWGAYRFNQAFHWNGYGGDHKAVSSSSVYLQTDNDGFMTIGMLWLPQIVIYYGNGVEIGRFVSDRIGSVQSNIICYMVSGGWDNTRLDDQQLPADFVIDYVRAWQRNDLASTEDGFKPNDGRPKIQSQRAD